MTGTILSALEVLTHFFIVGLEVERGPADGHQASFEMMGIGGLQMTAQLCNFTKNN